MTERHIEALRRLLPEWKFECDEGVLLRFSKPFDDQTYYVGARSHTDGADILCGEIKRALLKKKVSFGIVASPDDDGIVWDVRIQNRMLGIGPIVVEDASSELDGLLEATARLCEAHREGD